MRAARCEDGSAFILVAIGRPTLRGFAHQGKKMADKKRIALVTGANKGIGLEIARQLAEAGVHVIIGVRNLELGKRAAAGIASEGYPAESVMIDLNDEATISAAAERIGSTHGRLDILVNNAGIAQESDGPPSSASIAVVRQIVETNFIGTLAVTQAMVPLLRRSKSGTIVNLSTPLGSLTINGDPTSPFYNYRLIGYGASKAALNLLTLQLSAELRESGISVNSVVPGFVKTDLTGQQGNMTPAEGARLPVEYALLEDNTVSGRFVGPGAELPW